MVHKHLTLFLLIAVLVLTAFVTGIRSVSAAVVVDRGDIPVDVNLSDQDMNTYAPVKKIAVVSISAPQGVVFGEGDQWVRGLYYYSITKLGFVDMPFNYIVTWQGDIYEGKDGGYDVSPLVDGGSSDSSLSDCALVAYFDNRRETTNAGTVALSDILSELLSRYNLGRGDVIAADVVIAGAAEEGNPASLIVYASEDQDWRGTVSSSAQRAVISPADSNLIASVEEVLVPKSIKAGDEFLVTAHVKNDGQTPWYNSGTSQMVVATSDPRDRSSGFYHADSWMSFTRISPGEDKWVLPGEVGTFQFKARAPMIPGEYSEKFELISMPGTWIGSSQFTVSVTVEKGDFDLVRILETETGYLNVRECPSSGCTELGKVVPGDVLINVGSESGWYNVKLEDGTTGWVFGKYVEEIAEG